jgi:hypothetical protein
MRCNGMARLCTVDGCEKTHMARGLCGSHYNKARRTEWQPLPERVMARVNRNRADGCWAWTGLIDQTGYGRYLDRSAHRMVYEILVGPIPDGLHLDHICYNRSCVNPEHLRPVTNKQNIEHRSKSLQTNNTSGFHGVSWHKGNGSFLAKVSHHGVSYHVRLRRTGSPHPRPATGAPRARHAYAGRG